MSIGEEQVGLPPVGKLSTKLIPSLDTYAGADFTIGPASTVR